MGTKTVLTLAAAAMTGAAWLAVPGAQAAGTPRPDASHFTHGRVTNQWMPLKPGTRMVYRGRDEGDRSRDVVIVRHRTRRIEGVTCREVFDRVFINGHLAERTLDWYAQTRHGTVWYFGERTAELNRRGHVTSREGSWLAGRDGARAGVFMPARPRVGQTFRQEDYPGHAEDRFRVLDTSASLRVPVLTTRHALLTEEWTPLEPGVVDHKYYVRDLGVVREASVRGPVERLRLVSVSRAR